MPKFLPVDMLLQLVLSFQVSRSKCVLRLAAIIGFSFLALARLGAGLGEYWPKKAAVENPK